MSTTTHHAAPAGAPRRGSSPASIVVLVVSTLLFALMSICAKRASLRLPGAQVAFVRFAVGFAGVGVVALAGRRLRPRNLVGLAMRGVFGGLAVLLYFSSIAHLPVGTATLLNYTFPIHAAIFAAVFLGEHLGAATIGALALATAGVALVVLGGALPTGALPWVLAGIASAILSGAAVTTIRAARRTDGAWEIFSAFCVGGLAATAPFALPGWVAPDATEWAFLVAVGVLSLAAQIMFTSALRDVPAAAYGVISQLTPITAFGLGVAIYGDPVSAPVLVGAALTVSGVAWAIVVEQRGARG